LRLIQPHVHHTVGGSASLCFSGGRGGIVSVVHQSGAPIDEFSYGNFYNLSAENPYLGDSLIDSLGQRSSLKSVQRDAYGGGVSLGGAVAFGEGAVGDIEPGIDPEPTEKAVWGKYTLHRGRKVYELKNHLGNVLAVVSDVKIGVDVQQVNVPLVDYYVADVVEMTDYEPFGMQLANRHWMSGDRYRFGFNGKESDDEWNGDGNMVDFGLRIFAPCLGRFFSGDPLGFAQESLSPYCSAGNNPVKFIDFQGAFRLDPLFAKRYPNFAKFVRYALPILGQSASFVQQMEKTTGFSYESIQEMCKYGSGPWLSPTRDFDRSASRWYDNSSRVGAEFSEDNGKFEFRDYPDNIFVSHSRIEEFECLLNNGTCEDVAWASFQMMYIIGHETGHYANYKMEFEKGAEMPAEKEFGAMLEQNYFGERFSYRLDITASSPSDFAPDFDKIRSFFESKFYPANKPIMDLIASRIINGEPSSGTTAEDPSLRTIERKWEAKQPGYLLGQKIECGN
jgi:RHS repeat-associated protein